MSIQKRKRTDFTLKEKEEIIDSAKKEPNQSKLAREMSKEWGIEVKRTPVMGIISRKDAIEAVIKAGVPSKCMKLEPSHHSKLDDGVLMWLKQAKGQNLPVSGDLIKEKALKLADLMLIPNFMASNGWLDNFKKRHGITFKTVQGEAGAVDSQSLLEWQQQVLQHLLGQFSADDVFYLDETGLFWRLLPNKTMSFMGERYTRRKKSKQRITLLVEANMSGSEKFPLLAIGSSQKPRAFKNKEIPVKYKANSKAWMTVKLFEEVLREWNRRLGQ
uniref:tigger transposable element-derived protein 4-like n=1 Tax=Styela clava TaxID=7725 RepID=UPI0019394801|nr:tigger transposable element-derived protein 4-like [Styela clava]